MVFKGGFTIKGGFTLEFQCAEDTMELIDLPTCDVSDTIFGEVNYVVTNSTAYGSIDEKNIITMADVSEADCATVRLSDILRIRLGDFTNCIFRFNQTRVSQTV